jgi:hypothetical protein
MSISFDFVHKFGGRSRGCVLVLRLTLEVKGLFSAALPSVLGIRMSVWQNGSGVFPI